jgi:CBS domain containing-hemolysin-like protein
MTSIAVMFSGLLSIPVFLAANAVFVAAEFALVAIRRTRVRELVNEGAAGARAVERAVGNLDRYLATTQFGITLSSIGLGWLGEPALAGALMPAVSALGPRLSPVVAHGLSFAAALMGITFLHIVVAELVPRSVALRLPDRIALWLVPPLQVFERVFRPLIWVLTNAGHGVLRLLGMSQAPGHAGQVHSIGELALLVQASEDAGVLERQEREMMQGVLAFGDLTVGRLMVPREDIVSVRVTDPVETIIQTALESGYSRLPVWEASPGEVTGILNARDLLSFISETERGLMVVQDLVREPHFVKVGARPLDLLREFQRGEHHLALVLDDEGELAGLVTLEDLLEEIVGEIRDEYDTGERPAAPDFGGTP